MTSEPDGRFVVSNLPPGGVDILVTAPGFGDVKREGVLLEVGQTLSLAVELPVAAVRETVVVTGGIGLATIDTSRSVVDAVIPAAAIDLLPLNGRNFLELALLVPGNRIKGPAVVETTDTTVAVHPGSALKVDAFGNFEIGF